MRERAERDRVIWLTTVTPSGRPAPRPVWFVWDGTAFTVYSEPGAAKVRHIRANPHVTLNFNSDSGGGDVLVVRGRAEIADPPVPAADQPGYLDRYRDELPGLGFDAATFTAAYATQIRVVPESTWGF
jgi:PPOX class probable F420-dependent enzyme